jgi:hypothetical protein
MTTQQLNRVSELTAKLTTDDLKAQLLNDSLGSQVADWLMQELESRISEDEFIAFCESY